MSISTWPILIQFRHSAIFYEEIPLIERSVMCRTESGKVIEISKKTAAELSNAVLKIESDDPFWAKLQDIKHGWNIYWGLYGGDPEREDGGPVGNWMGIRPVHCRESVALFLNFTYMIDMPEHEQILRDNADQLYDDNKQPVKVEAVLQQMRRQNPSGGIGLPRKRSRWFRRWKHIWMLPARMV